MPAIQTADGRRGVINEGCDNEGCDNEVVNCGVQGVDI